MTYNIILGITGGIAAYKTPDLVRKLQKMKVNHEYVDVKVIITENGQKLVSTAALATVSKHKVYTDTFESSQDINHISLKEWADMLLVVPATANLIAKIACGIADDLLTTTFLAVDCPAIIAPAMNTAMWENQVTKDNVAKLKSRDITIVEPDSGTLASGAVGKGTLAKIDTILATVLEVSSPKEQFLAGKKVVVTAGPTREYLDPVRYITNPSSGKMGYALAEAARDMGAEVILISGQTNLNNPLNITTISVISTKDMAERTICAAKDADIIIGAAAPSDLTPVTYSEEKIKKTTGSEEITFTKTVDILKEIGKNKNDGQIIVAFAAESDEDELINYAKAKLKDKNADMIVANNIKHSQVGFSSDKNEGVIILKDGQIIDLPLQSKRDMARHILLELKESCLKGK